MHIVYIHQHFCTNKGSHGTRSFDVSRYLVDMGHKVTMISGATLNGGFDTPPWYRLISRMRIENFDVIVCNVSHANSMGRIRRIWAFMWFAFLATIAVMLVKKPDLIFATSTPLTVAIPGVIGAKFKRKPFVFEVRDLWPENFIRGGWYSANHPYVRAMFALERWTYKHARKILTVSPGFEERLIERGHDPDTLRTILLGADGSLFADPTPSPTFRERYSLDDKTVAIYTGAHGESNGLDYVLEAASHTRDRDDIAYVLLGYGGQKERLKKKAREMSLTNVVFADPVSKEQLPGILKVCNIGLMILKHLGEPRPVTPNKVFDYMFTGLPVLVNFEGPTWDMIRRDNSGMLASPTDPRDLGDKAIQLAEDPELGGKLGKNGRKAAVEKYDRKIIASQLLQTFREVLEGRRMEAVTQTF